MSKNSDFKKGKQMLASGDIVSAIKSTEGWFSPNRDNEVFIYHDKLKNLLFNKAFEKLPFSYKKHLLCKFNHKTHFLEGVSRAFALEYYYLSPDFDFKWEDKKIVTPSSSFKPTIPMQAYWHAIDEIVIEFFDKRSTIH